jgi:hypothetical protein
MTDPDYDTIKYKMRKDGAPRQPNKKHEKKSMQRLSYIISRRKNASPQRRTFHK